jgi:hypothetical protein
MQVLVNQRAFVEFNRREQQEAAWMRTSTADAVVIDDSETVCVVGPVITSRPVFLTTSQARATTLARILADAGVHSLLFVSRKRDQAISFEPYIFKAQQRTKWTTMQQWVLAADHARRTVGNAAGP